MFVGQVKPAVVAVSVAMSGASAPSVFCRLMGARVVFPDVGWPFVEELGFLRYRGEDRRPVEDASSHRETSGACPGS